MGLRSILGTATLAAALSGLSAVPAQACSCFVQETTGEAILEDGRPILFSRVLSARREGSGDINDGTLVYLVDVKFAFNSALEGEVEVRSAPNSAMCGVDLNPGQRVVLLPGRGEGEELWIGLCSQAEAESVDWDAFLRSRSE